MKVVSVLGSPRKDGNTAKIAKRFIDKATDLGADNQTFQLNALTFRGCQACMVCKTKLDRCVLEDDMARVLDAVRDADVLLLATPIYFCDASSQCKAFIDRAYSYLVSDYRTNPKASRLASGKKVVFIIAQGQPDENIFADVPAKYEFIFQFLGFDDCHVIRACGVVESNDVEQRKDILDQAERIAGKVVS